MKKPMVDLSPVEKGLVLDRVGGSVFVVRAVHAWHGSVLGHIFFFF